MGYRKFRDDEGPQFAPPFLGFIITVTVAGVALFATAQPQGPMGALRSVPSAVAPAVEASVEPAMRYDVFPASNVNGFATSAIRGGSEIENAADAAAPAAAKCNINACAAAYKSFDASDCTFQPFDGQRRLCTR